MNTGPKEKEVRRAGAWEKPWRAEHTFCLTWEATNTRDISVVVSSPKMN